MRSADVASKIARRSSVVKRGRAARTAKRAARLHRRETRVRARQMPDSAPRAGEDVFSRARAAYAAAKEYTRFIRRRHAPAVPQSALNMRARAMRRAHGSVQRTRQCSGSAAAAAQHLLRINAQRRGSAGAKAAGSTAVQRRASAAARRGRASPRRGVSAASRAELGMSAAAESVTAAHRQQRERLRRAKACAASLSQTKERLMPLPPAALPFFALTPATLPRRRPRATTQQHACAQNAHDIPAPPTPSARRRRDAIR